MGWVLAVAGREGSTWIKAARAGRDCCSGWARDPVRWGTVLTNGFSKRVRLCEIMALFDPWVRASLS